MLSIYQQTRSRNQEMVPDSSIDRSPSSDASRSIAGESSSIRTKHEQSHLPPRDERPLDSIPSHQTTSHRTLFQSSRRLPMRISSSMEWLEGTHTISSNQHYRQRMDEALLPALTHELQMTPALDCCSLPEDEGSLMLTSMGTCAIAHHGNTLCTVLEVPPRGEHFFLYSLVCRDSAPSVALMQQALELNYLGQQTRGATLSLDPSCDLQREGLQYTLSYIHQISGVDKDEFCLLVMNFMSTTKDIHDKLALVQQDSLRRVSR